MEENSQLIFVAETSKNKRLCNIHWIHINGMCLRGLGMSRRQGEGTPEGDKGERKNEHEVRKENKKNSQGRDERGNRKNARGGERERMEQETVREGKRI